MVGYFAGSVVTHMVEEKAGEYMYHVSEFVF